MGKQFNGICFLYWMNHNLDFLFVNLDLNTSQFCELLFLEYLLGV